MRVLVFLTAAAVIQAYALPNPKVILEGENGITVNDDGSTSIDGETGITTNAQGQPTNVGGSAGITIMPDVASNSTTKGTSTTGGKKGNLTTSARSAKGSGTNSGGVAGLAALIGAFGGVSSGLGRRRMELLLLLRVAQL